MSHVILQLWICIPFQETNPMKNNSPLNQVVMVALIAIAVISVTTVLSDYQGQVDFNLSPNGIKLGIGGSKQKI
jgi:hypothetical protein